MKYYRAFWDEPRGDQYDHWGTSWWYFKVHPDDFVVEQFEIYSGGSALCYSLEYLEDKYGGLAEGNWSDHDADARIEQITEDEFESIRAATTFVNVMHHPD